MKRQFKTAIRDNKGNWRDTGIVTAMSMIHARNITHKFDMKIGYPGSSETHRVVKGKTVYEYGNGAICIERL